MGFFDKFRQKKTPDPAAGSCSLLTRFDTSKIYELPTWDFWFHFRIPANVSDQKLLQHVTELTSLPLDVSTITSATSLENFNSNERIYSVGVNVSEERRQQPNALAAYESDSWKIMGHMAELNPSEIFYDAEGAQD